ncbi:MAG TPA: carboxypeptidase regulatory-like domain-containing protein [Terriglobales bacterium]|nr:carboxypeptidase regulatory-like domain-containing protein [Terriglobales bacterium]
MKPLRFAFSVVFAIFLLLELGLACSMQSSSRLLKPDFTVTVRDPNRKPLAGLHVQLTRNVDDKDVLFRSATTDHLGIARFTGVPESEYSLRIGNEGFPYSIWIKITKTDSQAARSLETDWPDDPISARNLAGRVAAPIRTGSPLWDLARPQFTPLANARVELHDFVTFELLAQTTTDAEGHFKFDEEDEGLYFLVLKRAGDDRLPNIYVPKAVALDVKSQAMILDLQLRHICGELHARQAQ